MPSPDIEGQQRGYVIPIGGAEEKINSLKHIDAIGISIIKENE